MRNRIWLVFLALVLVVSLVAFGACKAEEAPPVEEEAPPVEEEATPEEEVWEWPEKMNVLAPEAATAEYAEVLAWTTPLSKDTGIKVTIVCEISPRLKSLWLREGRFLLNAGSSIPDVLQAVGPNATRDAGPYQARIFYPYTIGDTGFMVRADSGIKTPYDIKPGTKIAYMTVVPIFRTIMEALLTWGNVSPDDVEWIPAADLNQVANFIIDGKADVAYTSPVHPSTYEVEASPHGLAWIELDAKADPDAALRFVEVYTTACFGIMNSGVPSAISVPSLSRLNPMSVWPDADEDLVYQLVKWLDENYDKYKDAHPWCAQMTVENLLALSETHYQPLHEGAVRYLEEKGLWTDRHQSRWQQNVELLDKWIEAYQQAIDYADSKEIAVNPENEEWLNVWVEFSSDLPPLKLFFGGLD